MGTNARVQNMSAKEALDFDAGQSQVGKLDIGIRSYENSL